MILNILLAIFVALFFAYFTYRIMDYRLKIDGKTEEERHKRAKIGAIIIGILTFLMALELAIRQG